MVTKIRWAPRAASNFEDICNYIANDSEFYAAVFAKKINAVIKTENLEKPFLKKVFLKLFPKTFVT